MTMPRKKRRNITVGDTLYHYKVEDFVCIIIQNTKTDKIFKYWEDWKPKWKMSYTPRDIRKLILDNGV